MRDYGHTRAAGGFTLTEVLVVMLILGLLMGILMPIIGVVRLRMQVGRSQVRKETISNAVVQFHMDYHYYPGQMDIDTWEGVYTGSQALAAHLFGYHDPAQADPYEDVQLENPNPSSSSGYITWTPDMLFHRGDGAMDRNFLSDAFNTPKPLAYYPSGGGVGTAQFSYDLNSAFTGSNVTSFGNHIEDYSHGTADIPYNDGGFLLIGPGADRIYFNEDDVHNWAD